MSNWNEILCAVDSWRVVHDSNCRIIHSNARISYCHDFRLSITEVRSDVKFKDSNSAQQSYCILWTSAQKGLAVSKRTELPCNRQPSNDRPQPTVNSPPSLTSSHTTKNKNKTKHSKLSSILQKWRGDRHRGSDRIRRWSSPARRRRTSPTPTSPSARRRISAPSPSPDPSSPSP